MAFLRGQQAAAAAMTDARHTALGWLKEAESALSRADDRRDAVGGYDQAAYFFHEAHVHWHLGDHEASIASLHRSNAARSPLERQGRLHCTGVIAERQFRMRHIEAACQTWGTFLDEHVTISSARGDEHLKTGLPRSRRRSTAALSRRGAVVFLPSAGDGRAAPGALLAHGDGGGADFGPVPEVRRRTATMSIDNYGWTGLLLAFTRIACNLRCHDTKGCARWLIIVPAVGMGPSGP
ncbi:hypothetical protein ACIBCU_22295 [Streptomyces sp. NPDC051064]|uniref:hypothetical protein n=1 Tax=Streptomyces sp. NPDC051064 TaxID=3365641 RepID=UPI00379637C3